MQLQALKAILAGLGIKDLSIKFDPGRQEIIASFIHGPERHQRIITFAEIEAAFRDGPTTSVKGSNLDERTPAGNLHTPLKKT